MEEIRCPNCGKHMFWKEAYDYLSNDDEQMERSCYICETCNKKFLVDVFYKYSHYKIIEEEE